MTYNYSVYKYNQNYIYPDVLNDSTKHKKSENPIDEYFVERYGNYKNLLTTDKTLPLPSVFA